MLRVLRLRRGGPGPSRLRHRPPTSLAALALALGLALGFATFAVAEDVPLVELAAPAGRTEGVAVLCPDLGVSTAVFLVPGASDLPARLSARGYRVLAVDPWSSDVARERGFDGVVDEVYPAALAEASAGGEEVLWIGQGLCGMLPVAAAGAVPEPRWIALGTRLDVRLPSDAALALATAWAGGEQPDREVLARAWWTGVREDRPGRAGSAPAGAPVAGTTAERMARLGRNVIEQPVPAEVARDLLRWLEQGVASDRAGGRDYLAGLEQVRGPALLVSGASDPLAPPEDVLAGLDRAAGADVRHRMLSVVNAHREEYGHLGMLLSRTAGRDLDRVVLAWLRGQAVLP